MPTEASVDPLQPKPRQNRRTQRTLPLIAAAIIVILAGVTWFQFGGPRRTDGDLQPVRRVVPEAQNGFALLALEPDSVYRPADSRESSEISSLGNGKGSNWKLAKDTLARNGKILRRFAESQQRPEFQFPAVEGSTRWSSVVVEWIQLAKLLNVKVFLRAHTDGVPAGIQEAINTVGFGDRVQAAQGNLNCWTMGGAIKEMGLYCVRILLLRSGMESQQLVDVARQLEPYEANREGFIFAMKRGYQENLEHFDKLAAGERHPVFFAILGDRLPEKGDFDPESAKRLVAVGTRSMIRLVKDHEPTWGLQQPPEPFTSRPNNLGDALYELQTEVWRNLLKQGAMTDTALAATRTLLALRAYKQDTGELPPSLDKLVPSYLPKVPTDPFDGKPLRYSPSKRIVYSVGEDLRDRGGSKKSRISMIYDSAEPTFPIEF